MNNIVKNRGTGAGGAKTNQTGIAFEKKIYLKQMFEEKGYHLEKISKAKEKNYLYKVFKEQKHIGYYGIQNQIYNALYLINKRQFSQKNIEKVFSKKIHPDSFIISLKPRQLTIFEKKWQQSEGSVDEKIQTAPYKLHMFEKLLRNANISCQYQYILSKWFQKKTYRNVKEYYKTKANYKAKGGIKLFIEKENLHHLNIDDYFK